MVVPVGQGWAEARRRAIVHHNFNVFKKRFQKRGVDFTCGYVAGIHGCAPRWWIRFREFLGGQPDDPIYAARAALEEAGVDPWRCSNSVYNVQEEPIDGQAG